MPFDKNRCPNDSHGIESQKILKNANLKMTKKRVLIIDCFKHSNVPLTADDVFNILRENTNINLSTIYRALSALTDSEILTKQTLSDGTYVFQLNGDVHRHILTCKECGKIDYIEFCPIEKTIDDITSKTGFEITGHSLEFTGICPDCKKNLK